ncbi:hypothetical protein BC834DRAFT_1036289 [Gloeopeniophorella convolvens]|nr:hypothetical protein BC834DRAFT_1036289 [Gloeopeniophorella convolvens]
MQGKESRHSGGPVSQLYAVITVRNEVGSIRLVWTTGRLVISRKRLSCRIKLVGACKAQSEAIVESADRREAALHEQVDRARTHAEGTETRAAELERMLEKVNCGKLRVPTSGGAGSAPLKPARGGASWTNKTFVKVYADHVQLQDEYAHKCAEYDRIDRTPAQIEERQRAEYERLHSEVAQLTSQLANALTERNAGLSGTSNASQRLAKTTRENEHLQKQSTTSAGGFRCSRSSDDSTTPPSRHTVLDAGKSTLPADTINEVIMNYLMFFHSIPALQAQNQKLLDIVCEMGAKTEVEECKYRTALEREQGGAVRRACDATAARCAGNTLRALLARAEHGSGAKDGEAQDEAKITNRLADVDHVACSGSHLARPAHVMPCAASAALCRAGVTAPPTRARSVVPWRTAVASSMLATSWRHTRSASERGVGLRRDSGRAGSRWQGRSAIVPRGVVCQ